MPHFEPERYAEDAQPVIAAVDGQIWTPVIRHGCTFDEKVFILVMENFAKNPNLNSSWLFRADILQDEASSSFGDSTPEGLGSHVRDFKEFQRVRIMVRKLIPRNPKRDEPLIQTCMFLSNEGEMDRGTTRRHMVVYIPHVSDQGELPFYHPKVRGIAHLHEWDSSTGQGAVSLHIWHFEEQDLGAAGRLDRTLLMILSQLHKHGQGSVAGYVKRVHHDAIIPQSRFQDVYTRLKNEYGRQLVTSWAEHTDPTKHVFEDLGIAAFLIELWKDMYTENAFPGFVDIGCGNGLLVYILRKEGYQGWGFDARARKSWHAYNMAVDAEVGHALHAGTDSLQARVLLPCFVERPSENTTAWDETRVHDGVFPTGTFIISNHADELTPWTPILAARSRSSFIAIPCCSHNLTGQKFRAPPPADTSKGKSTYASLVAWVSNISADCGYEVETEALRIPSTRNTALIGRKFTAGDSTDLGSVIAKYGGAMGYCENISKLLKTGLRGH